MKTGEEIEETLKSLKPFLKEKFKVKEIGVFGSYVRGDGTEESDVDILVEFHEPKDGNLLTSRKFWKRFWVRGWI